MTLHAYRSHEQYQEPERSDQYLVGVLQLVCIGSHHQLLEEQEEVAALCHYVFYECLFNVPRKGDPGAKCKSAHSRRVAYGVLHKLNEKYPASGAGGGGAGAASRERPCG